MLRKSSYHFGNWTGYGIPHFSTSQSFASIKSYKKFVNIFFIVSNNAHNIK